MPNLDGETNDPKLAGVFGKNTANGGVGVAGVSDTRDGVRTVSTSGNGLSAFIDTAQLSQRVAGFNVVRERNGDVAGCYVLFEAARLSPETALDDSVLAQWQAHLAANPVAPSERVLFCRRWLSRADGEAPSAVQAACWPDVKGVYMVHRPHPRRVCMTVPDVASHAAASTELGFVVLDTCATTIAGAQYLTALLDFGPDSVDGWFAKLVAAGLGIATSSLLDVGARELVVGSRRAALTRREFDTLHYLVQRAGNVVDREEILRDVWGDDADVASNVVDVVVRSLRKKLAERANVIETISGIGYRLRETEAATR